MPLLWFPWFHFWHVNERESYFNLQTRFMKGEATKIENPYKILEASPESIQMCPFQRRKLSRNTNRSLFIHQSFMIDSCFRELCVVNHGFEVDRKKEEVMQRNMNDMNLLFLLALLVFWEDSIVVSLACLIFHEYCSPKRIKQGEQKEDMKEKCTASTFDFIHSFLWELDSIYSWWFIGLARCQMKGCQARDSYRSLRLLLLSLADG